MLTIFSWGGSMFFEIWKSITYTPYPGYNTNINRLKWIQNNERKSSLKKRSHLDFKRSKYVAHLHPGVEPAERERERAHISSNPDNHQEHSYIFNDSISYCPTKSKLNHLVQWGNQLLNMEYLRTFQLDFPTTSGQKHTQHKRGCNMHIIMEKTLWKLE